MITGFGKRRGLSSVVTSAIMLSAVAVLGASIVGWSNSNLATFENALANSTASYSNEVNENLNIENVQFCHSECPKSNHQVQSINITLTNTGTLGVIISKLQINSTVVTPTAPIPAVNPPPVLPYSLLPKGSITFGINNTKWNPNDLSTVSVTTKRGSIFTTQVTAP
jgi:archaellum component FlaF (FlaF/FlaG flagellin family)